MFRSFLPCGQPHVNEIHLIMHQVTKRKRKISKKEGKIRKRGVVSWMLTVGEFHT